MKKRKVDEIGQVEALVLVEPCKPCEAGIDGASGFTRSHLFELLEDDLDKSPKIMGPEQSMILLDSFQQVINIYGHFGGAAFHGWKKNREGLLKCEDCLGFGENGLVVVADGIGGYPGASEAALIVVRSFLENSKDFVGAAIAAINELKVEARRMNVPQIGAAFLAYRPVWSGDSVKLEVLQAGDVRLLIHDAEGNLVEMSDDNTVAVEDCIGRVLTPRDLTKLDQLQDSLYGVHHLTRALTSTSGLGELVYYQTEASIGPGYTVTAVSDGLSENLAANVDPLRPGDPDYNFDDFGPVIKAANTMYELFDLLGIFVDGVSLQSKGIKLDPIYSKRLAGIWKKGLEKRYLKIDHISCAH